MSQNVHADTACRYPANNADRMGRSKQRISFLGEGAPWGGAGAVKRKAGQATAISLTLQRLGGWEARDRQRDGESKRGLGEGDPWCKVM